MIQNTVMSIYRKADEKKQNIFENLYLLFFVMITVMAFKDTTMFSYGWTDTQLHLVFIFGVLVVFAKISCGRPWKLYEILIAGIAAGVLILCWHHYMRRYVLELAVLIIGARDVDSDKVIRVFLWVSTGCLLVTMAAALTGDIIFTACLGVFCLYFCGARTSALGLWILALFFLLKKKEILKENRKIQRAGVFCMPVCAVGSILLALLYNQDYGWMRLLNRILNTRLSQGHEGFERYSIPLLGQEVVMNGNGGALHLKDGVEYFFLDSSYINILLQYGILVLAMLTVLSVWIMFRLMKAQMPGRMFILMVVFLCCVMEQHLMEIAYHPFWLMALTGMMISDKNQTHLWRKN